MKVHARAHHLANILEVRTVAQYLANVPKVPAEENHLANVLEVCSGAQHLANLPHRVIRKDTLRLTISL